MAPFKYVVAAAAAPPHGWYDEAPRSLCNALAGALCFDTVKAYREMPTVVLSAGPEARMRWVTCRSGPQLVGAQLFVIFPFSHGVSQKIVAAHRRCSWAKKCGLREWDRRR